MCVCELHSAVRKDGNRRRGTSNKRIHLPGDGCLINVSANLLEHFECYTFFWIEAVREGRKRPRAGLSEEPAKLRKFEVPNYGLTFVACWPLTC